MHCKGCDYDVVLNPSELITKFDEIIIELHKWFGNHRRVGKSLQRSFGC